jgi:hypothetical protein
MTKQEEYYEAKAEAEELQHAKDISDQILGMMGLPLYGQAPVRFPGLGEARARQSRLLDEWTKEEA